MLNYFFGFATTDFTPNHLHKDAIHYPSVQYNANADNFAIAKHVIDEQALELEKVEFIRIESVNNNIYTYKIIDVADEFEGHLIKWSNPNKTWTFSDQIDDVYFIREKGQHYAYDQMGNEIKSENTKL